MRAIPGQMVPGSTRRGIGAQAPVSARREALPNAGYSSPSPMNTTLAGVSPKYWTEVVPPPISPSRCSTSASIGTSSVQSRSTRTWPNSSPPPCAKPMPLALSDKQLEFVMAAAQPLDPDKRILLLERVAARLRFTVSGTRPSDADVAKILDRCIRGLMQAPAA
jgi:hypothetical protein